MSSSSSPSRQWMRVHAIADDDGHQAIEILDTWWCTGEGVDNCNRKRQRDSFSMENEDCMSPQQKQQVMSPNDTTPRPTLPDTTTSDEIHSGLFLQLPLLDARDDELTRTPISTKGSQQVRGQHRRQGTYFLGSA